MASHREVMPNGRSFLTAGALTLLVTLALCNGSNSRSYRINDSDVKPSADGNSLGKADLLENNYSSHSENYGNNKR